MKIVNTQPTKTATVKKEGLNYAVMLYDFEQYQETFYCKLKRDIKPQLKKLGYTLTYDFTLLKTI